MNSIHGSPKPAPESVQQQAPRHVHHVWDINIDYPNLARPSMQSDHDLTTMSLGQNFVSNEMYQNWHHPSQTAQNRHVPNNHSRRGAEMSPQAASQYLSANSCSHFDHAESAGTGGYHAGHGVKNQHAASQAMSHFDSSKQTTLLSFAWNAGHVSDVHGHPRTVDQSPGAEQVLYSKESFGLMTPISTDAQNSPQKEGFGDRMVSLDGLNDRVVAWAPNETSASQPTSDASTMNDFTNNRGQVWPELALTELDFSFDLLDPSWYDRQFTDVGSAPVQPHETTTSQSIAPIACLNNNQEQSTYLTQPIYPDPELNFMSSLAGLSQQEYYYPDMRPPATSSVKSGIADSSDAYDTPSSTDSVPQTPPRSSPRDNAKDAFLVRCKRQGMSYKEIKLRGKFDEAESTLRGRYRTLTKLKEQRVRRPEWSDQNVSCIEW